MKRCVTGVLGLVAATALSLSASAPAMAQDPLNVYVCPDYIAPAGVCGHPIELSSVQLLGPGAAALCAGTPGQTIGVPFPPLVVAVSVCQP